MEPTWALTKPGVLSLQNTKFTVVLIIPGDYRIYQNDKQIPSSGSYSILSYAKQRVLELVREMVEMGMEP